MILVSKFGCKIGTYFYLKLWYILVSGENVWVWRKCSEIWMWDEERRNGNVNVRRRRELDKEKGEGNMKIK